MEEWRRHPTVRRKYGQNGRPSARCTECVRTWTGKTLKIARITTGFGGKIRCGKRKTGQVGAGMVRAGLGGVEAKIVIDTGEQPLHQKDGTHYVKPIQLMLAGFSKFDPVVEKELAAHPDLPRYAVTRGNRKRSSEKQKAIGDLVNVGFYWLL